MGIALDPPPPPLSNGQTYILFNIHFHYIQFTAAWWWWAAWLDPAPSICGERSIRARNVFFHFFQTAPDNSEQLKAIWGCRGQVGRLMAFHFSCPTFKQGNNIKVSWFYHEVCFASIFALFELLLAGLASRISWVIYYQNDGLMCAREWFPSLPLFNVQASNNVSHQHCISSIHI